MIVRELLTKLGFSADESKVRRYDAAVQAVTTGLVAAAAASTTFALVANRLVNETAKYGDELSKTANKLGITADGLERLRFAAERSGVESSTLDMALQRMTRRLSEAAQGSGEAKDAIKELGLDAQALASMGPEKAMMAIADALKGVENQSDKVRLAFKFFDSQGVDLINMVGDGADKVARLGAEFERLSGGLTGDQARAAEAYTDAMFNMQMTLEGIRLQIGSRLMPVMQPMIESFTEFLVVNREFILQRTEEAFDAIVRVVSMLSRIAGGAFDLFQRFLGALTGTESEIVAIVGVLLSLATAFGKLRGAILFIGFLAALDDIAAWMEGQPSLIEKLLGPYDEFAEKVQKAADAIGALTGTESEIVAIVGVLLPLAAAFGKLRGAILFSGFLAALGDIAAWMEGQPSLIEKLLGPYDEFAKKVQKAADAIGGFDRIAKGGALIAAALGTSRLAKAVAALATSLTALGTGAVASGMKILSGAAALGAGTLSALVGTFVAASAKPTADGTTKDFPELDPRSWQGGASGPATPPRVDDGVEPPATPPRVDDGVEPPDIERRGPATPPRVDDGTALSDLAKSLSKFDPQFWRHLDLAPPMPPRADEVGASGGKSVTINDNRSATIMAPEGSTPDQLEAMQRELERFFESQASDAAVALEAQ